MSKKKVFFNILKSILSLPLMIGGIILAIPFGVLYIMAYIPMLIIADIWDLDIE